jgi:hypothetical protein
VSYDLYALRVPTGMTVEDALEAQEEEVDRKPTSTERAAMERLADALTEVDPNAERFDGGDLIELTGEAVQVSVFATSAGLSVPYWFDEAEADPVLERALEYARVLREAGGYTIYDPQLGETLDDDSSARLLGESYSPGRNAVRRLESEAEHPARPRWQFWRR